MDAWCRERIASKLERLGYLRDPDGTFRICRPFRGLEQSELEQIFFDGANYSAQPKRNFDALMEQLSRQELEALAGQLEEPELPPEELAGLVRVCPPVHEYLRQRCRCDILVDTGDSGWDYSMNTLAPGYDGFIYGVGYRLYDEASIVWLTKQQGHTKRELADALHWITAPMWCWTGGAGPDFSTAGAAAAARWSLHWNGTSNCPSSTSSRRCRMLCRTDTVYIPFMRTTGCGRTAG